MLGRLSSRLSLSSQIVVENSFAPSFLLPLRALQVKTPDTGPCDGSFEKKLPSRINLGVDAGLADKFAELGGQIRRSEKPVIAEELGMLSIERFEFVQAM